MNAPNRQQLKRSQAKGQAANVNNSENRPPCFDGQIKRLFPPAAGLKSPVGGLIQFQFSKTRLSAITN
jgi:hypothetical protein